ncbi:MAG: hypothetical protein [Bacteriophage sp.]|nr:MAG: hypothetical protein [Bacteriophage sp.]
MTGTNVTNVDTKHKLYDARVTQICKLVNDCIVGEIAMRNRLLWPGEDPKMEGNAADRHRMEKYTRGAAFLNATRRTLNSWTGIVFSTPVMTDIKTKSLAGLQDNADGNSQPLSQMVRDALTEVLKTGRAALVPIYDSGVTFDDEGNPIIQTVEQAQAATMKIRLFYNEDIINWRTVERQDRLVVFKYSEQVDDPSSFGNSEITIWHEYRMIDGEAFQRRWWSTDSKVPDAGLTPNTAGSAGVTELTPIIIGGKRATSLPISWIGAVNNDSYPDEAPLYDIASLNEKHYQIEADLAELTHLVGQPTVVITGSSPQDKENLKAGGVKLGSRTAIPLTGNAKIELLQAEERNSVIALAERREKQMATIGAQMIDNNTTAKTATEADYDAQSDTSSLSLVAGNTESAFNKVFQMMGELAGDQVNDGVVTLNKQYTSSTIDGQTLTAMLQVVQAGKMTTEDFVSWMVRGNLIELSGRTIDQVVDDINNQAPTISLSQGDNPFGSNAGNQTETGNDNEVTDNGDN